MSDVTTTAIHLEARGFIPNNPRLPVLIYAQAFTPHTDLASVMEQRLDENGWPPQWRDGIYDFDHYHSRGHEVLGIAAGTVDLVLGGDGGRAISVKAGDVLLLPAGTGHRRIEQSRDLLVVGAYPPGQSGDIVREAPTPAMRQQIAFLPFPLIDPVLGRDGPLLRLWPDTIMGKA